VVRDLNPIIVVKGLISDSGVWKKSGLKGRTELVCPTGFSRECVVSL